MGAVAVEVVVVVVVLSHSPESLLRAYHLYFSNATFNNNNSNNSNNNKIIEAIATNRNHRCRQRLDTHMAISLCTSVIFFCDARERRASRGAELHTTSWRATHLTLRSISSCGIENDESDDQEKHGTYSMRHIAHHVRPFMHVASSAHNTGGRALI